MKILILDDEPFVLELLKLLLTQILESPEISEASNPIDGLAQLLACNPDLIVTDIVMANGTGIDLAKALVGKGLGIPVLFISGYMRAYISEIGELRGAIPLAVLDKPFSHRDFEAKITELLGSRAELKTLRRAPSRWYDPET